MLPSAQGSGLSLAAGSSLRVSAVESLSNIKAEKKQVRKYDLGSERLCPNRIPKQSFREPGAGQECRPPRVPGYAADIKCGGRACVSLPAGGVDIRISAIETSGALESPAQI